MKIARVGAHVLNAPVWRVAGYVVCTELLLWVLVV